jgi:lipopolysaccharide biosynthesis protein
MKSICFFSSYFEKNKLPYFIQSYLLELKNHFNEVILISNEKELQQEDLSFLKNNEIEWMPVKNEGYDFGMWHKAFSKFPVQEYDRVGLVNDSCILFKKLDKTFKVIDSSAWDYCGLMDSVQVEYHIQSYFLIMNKVAVKLVNEYFSMHGMKSSIDDVIKIYEVGLTPYLQKRGLKVGAVYHYRDFGTVLNPTFFKVIELIKAGFPLIKKKIIFGNYKQGEIRNLSSGGFRFNREFYLEFIRKNCSDLILDFDRLRKDYADFYASRKIYFESLCWTLYYRLRNPVRNVYRKIIK